MATKVEGNVAEPEAAVDSSELVPEEVEVGLIPLWTPVKNLAFRLFGYPQLVDRA